MLREQNLVQHNTLLQFPVYMAYKYGSRPIPGIYNLIFNIECHLADG